MEDKRNLLIFKCGLLKEEMAAQGRPIGSSSLKKQRSSTNGDKVVAPIKIRISARKKKRNDDDDDDTNR